MLQSKGLTKVSLACRQMNTHCIDLVQHHLTICANPSSKIGELEQAQEAGHARDHGIWSTPRLGLK